MKTYCIVCKKEKENKNPNVFKTKNEICAVCNKWRLIVLSVKHLLTILI